MNLTEIVSTMTAIQTFKSIKEKSKIVKSRADFLAEQLTAQPELERVFNVLLNDFIVTGIAKAKITKTLPEPDEQMIVTFDDFLTDLETHNTATNARLQQLQGYIKQQPADTQDFLIALATKSFKTGFAVSSYNKVMTMLGHKLLPEFNVQLAENIDKLTPDKRLVGDVVVTEKLDGVRTIVLIKDGQVSLFTRNGKPIAQAVEIEREIASMPFDEAVLDGELLVSEFDGRAEDAFRATMKIVGADGVKTGLCLHVFDYQPSVDDYLSKTSADMTYADRREWLDNTLQQYATTHVAVVHALAEYDVETPEELDKVFDVAHRVIAQGGEGAMLNVTDAPYQFKRTKHLLKVKQANENDGEIVGTFMGQGNIAGLLGGIIVRYKDTTVRVGSGFSLEERRQYANNPDQLIGRMATYMFTTESHNEAGDVSVRFPRFKALRLDKTPADASYDN